MEALRAGGEPIKAYFGGGERQFVSRLIHVDPVAQHFLVALSDDARANAELIECARATFVTEPSAWHLEFVAAGAQQVTHGQQPAIRFGFPEVLSHVDKRAHARASGMPKIRMQCVADEGGVMPFDGWLVDVSHGGLGFLTYAAAIQLEPGTVLRQSSIYVEGMPPLVVDLEVRYSEFVTLPDGTQGKRSGCRFVNAPEGLNEMISLFGET